MKQIVSSLFEFNVLSLLFFLSMLVNSSLICVKHLDHWRLQV